MPFYHRLGEIPPKRHVQFRRADGSLYHEEVMGTRGFSGVQSILYHERHPTAVKEVSLVREESVEIANDIPMGHQLLRSAEFKTVGDPITSRVWLMVNNDVKLGLSTPTERMNYTYRNGVCDELIFVHEGTGCLHSVFGDMDFEPGDYIVLPVGVTYQLECTAPSRLLVLESRGRIEFPKRYRNEYGQLLEHAPFCERDIRVPERLSPKTERGEFEVHVKMGAKVSCTVLDHHPFDVVGWDGYLYPWIFNIRDFEPITGRLHQPPPTHQTFVSDGFVVCSFVPRMYDYHPDAVPIPYNHSNVNSDEVLYYVRGKFMSRAGSNLGCFTVHPAGLPHGPHPGAVERSIGATSTNELAVMVDTFAPLALTRAAAELVDPDYISSWAKH